MRSLTLLAPLVVALAEASVLSESDAPGRVM
jgi:hypothetical protein